MISPVTSLWAEVWRRACIAYYSRALTEIWPLHEDVPAIVHRLHYLRRTK